MLELRYRGGRRRKFSFDNMILAKKAVSLDIIIKISPDAPFSFRKADCRQRGVANPKRYGFRVLASFRKRRIAPEPLRTEIPTHSAGVGRNTELRYRLMADKERAIRNLPQYFT